MEAFKLFLLRAAEFYQNLISKVRGYFGEKEESNSQKSRFLCHRFYICLGDLERYKEQYMKTDEHPNWSTAATYYLEAAKSWPDSGNPHNQVTNSSSIHCCFCLFSSFLCDFLLTFCVASCIGDVCW